MGKEGLRARGGTVLDIDSGDFHTLPGLCCGRKSAHDCFNDQPPTYYHNLEPAANHKCPSHQSWIRDHVFAQCHNCTSFYFDVSCWQLFGSALAVPRDVRPSIILGDTMDLVQCNKYGNFDSNLDMKLADLADLVLVPSEARQQACVGVLKTEMLNLGLYFQ